MSTPEVRTPPSVETSMKFMSWDVKGINQSLKDLCTIMRSIDLNLKDALTQKIINAKPVAKPPVSDEIPF